MKNIFEKINNNKVQSVELNAFANNKVQPESQLSKISDLDSNITNIKQKILEDQKLICEMYGNSPDAVLKISELQNKKLLLKKKENDKDELIKNN